MTSLCSLAYFGGGAYMQGAGGSAAVAFRAVFTAAKTCSLEPLRVCTVDEPGRLSLNVLFTDYVGAVAALKSTAALSWDLPADITLLLPLTVPYPLPLDDPPVSLDFVCRRITELASAITPEVDAYVYLCRDPLEAILSALRPHSLIVIGAPRRWLFNRSKRIARKLRRNGHEVILARYS